MPNLTETDLLKKLGIGLPRWRVIVGDGYTTGQLFTGVGGNNVKKLYLENPTSDTYYLLTLINSSSSEKQIVQEVANVTEDTQGAATDTGVVTKRSDSSNDSQAIVRKGGDNETGVYSGGTPYSKKTGGSAGTPSSVSPFSRSLEGIAGILAPGDNVVLEVTNDTANTNDISMDFDWVEITENDFPV